MSNKSSDQPGQPFGDQNAESDGGILPFSPINRETNRTSAPNLFAKQPVLRKNGKKLHSRRKQIKKAKRTVKSPVNVKQALAGFFILLVVTVGLTAVLNPQALNSIANGSIFEKTEVCEVTETNSTQFFDTSCGTFKWDAETLGGSPQESLIETQSYTFTSKGYQVAPAKVFPTIITYGPVEAVEGEQ